MLKGPLLWPLSRLQLLSYWEVIPGKKPGAASQQTSRVWSMPAGIDLRGMSRTPLAPSALKKLSQPYIPDGAVHAEYDISAL